MVRKSKQWKRRHVSPRKHLPPAEKTGPKKDNLAEGFRVHANALEGDFATQAFIGKVR